MTVDVDGIELDTVVDANPGHRFNYGFHADLSPDGARIVYSSCEYPTGEVEMSAADRESEREKYNYEIATVAVDGSVPERLTENDDIDHYPVWSPDMTRIAFLSGERYPNVRRLTVVRRDGSGPPESVALDSAAWIAPLWSSDGQRIAFFGYANPDDYGKYEWPYHIPWALYTVRLDGTGLTRIAEHTGAAAWSPDGQHLAVARVAGEDVVLSTVAPDGSDPRWIIKTTDRETSFPDIYPIGRFGRSFGHVSWSPDGTHILYVCEVGVCVVDADGNAVGQSPAGLIPDQGSPYAAWSPDGSRIAVRAPGSLYADWGGPQYGDNVNPHAEGSAAVFTMARDGTDVQVLVRGGPPEGPPLVAENAP